MKYTHKHLYLAWVLLIPSISIAQQQRIVKDSSVVDVTYFEGNLREKYTGNAFNYSINDTGGVNLIQRVLRKLVGWVEHIFGFKIDFIDYKTLEFIIYGLLAIIILYLLIKFLLEKPISKVFKADDKRIDGFSYVEEDIEQVDFEALIKKALKANNYRLATRYMYLKCLKVLAKNKTIEWHYDKTNSDYLNEIKDTHLKQLFKRVSHTYEYVWYGKFPLDEVGFQKHKTDFNAIIKVTTNG